jgi:hypothetical protein
VGAEPTGGLGIEQGLQVRAAATEENRNLKHRPGRDGERLAGSRCDQPLASWWLACPPPDSLPRYSFPISRR